MRGRRGAIVLAAALAVVGCGGAGGADSVDPGSGFDPSRYEEALAEAPRALADLYADGSVRIDGGEAVYDETLDSVAGFPVVVNQWGSWCGPCRTEFPMFQEQAAERLDEVAFLGVNTQDSADAYSTFIEAHPVPYPSVVDDDGELNRWIDVPLVGVPNTLFYDREGELVYTHQGPYESEEDLSADIERYALGS